MVLSKMLGILIKPTIIFIYYKEKRSVGPFPISKFISDTRFSARFSETLLKQPYHFPYFEHTIKPKTKFSYLKNLVQTSCNTFIKENSKDEGFLQLKEDFLIDMTPDILPFSKMFELCELTIQPRYVNSLQILNIFSQKRVINTEELPNYLRSFYPTIKTFELLSMLLLETFIGLDNDKKRSPYKKIEIHLIKIENELVY